MQTVPSNIPMMFHRSNLKTEDAVRESLRTAKNVKFYKFLAKIGPYKQKIKIPLQRPHADSAKEHSDEVLSL